MKAQKRERVDELAALGRFMGDPAARRWLYQILSECHLWVTAGATNALSMSFREGSRYIGLRLQAEVMAANHDMYLQMLKEMEVERPGSIGSNGYGNSDAGAYAEPDDGGGAGSSG